MSILVNTVYIDTIIFLLFFVSVNQLFYNPMSTLHIYVSHLQNLYM